MNNSKKSFGSRLKLSRQKQCISQGELSRLTKIAPAMLSRYEKDVVKPNIKHLKILTETLKVSADYLIGNKPPKNELERTKRILENLINFESEKEVKKGVLK